MNAAFNAAATLLPDGTTLLLCRGEDRSGISHLCSARSKNGVDNWDIEDVSTLAPDQVNHPEETWGIEDPRITYLPEKERYAIAYTAYSEQGAVVSLALTADFKEFERLGPIITPWNKDAALFPRRFNGRWALIHRPMTGNHGAHMWLSYSEDLIHWGDHKMILKARKGSLWDANKIGLSPPPIETDRGWLILYHGVRETASGSIYRIGLALLDIEDPTRCLQRGDKWIFGPETNYELSGDVGNVVFPCGYTIGEDNDTLNLYYGGADTCMALAKGSIAEMLDWLDEHAIVDE